MRRAKKAVLFFGQTDNGNVARMTGGLKRGLEACGVATTDIDTAKEGYAGQLVAAEWGGVGFFLGMTGIGLDLRAEGNIFNRIGRPFVSVYLDPLFLYADQIRTPIVRRLVTTTSDCDVDFWAEAAPDLAISHLPHAAEPLEPAAWAGRDIAFLYPATGCADPEAGRRDEWPRHGERVAAALNAIVEEQRRRPLEPLTEAIRTVVGGTVDMANPLAVHPYFVTVDRYLRAAVRWQTLAGLAGLPVTVAGPGWEAFRQRFPDSGFTFLGSRTAVDVQALIRRSRAVLNTCTGYHGSHERVLDAQAAGALAVTTPTRWFCRNAPEDAIAYVGDGEGDGAGPLRALLADPGGMAAAAKRGRAWQAAHHTWRHRAETLLRRLAGRGEPD